jgi:hypothetical protein
LERRGIGKDLVMVERYRITIGESLYGPACDKGISGQQGSISTRDNGPTGYVKGKRSVE